MAETEGDANGRLRCLIVDDHPVVRQGIRSLLEKLPWVESFHDAEASGGGWGATVVYLKDEG